MAFDSNCDNPISHRLRIQRNNGIRKEKMKSSIKSVLDGTHVLVIGSTGMGKSFWMSEIAKKYLPVFIFINPQMESSIEAVCEVNITRPGDILEALDEGYSRIEFIPSEDDKVAIEELKTMRKVLFELAGDMNVRESEFWVSVIIDEAQLYAPLHSRSDLENFARRGRRFGIRCWFLSQQPQNLSKGIVNNVEHQIIFRLGQYSRTYFHEYKIPIEDHLEHLQKPFHYLVWDGFEMSEEPPIVKEEGGGDEDVCPDCKGELIVLDEETGIVVCEECGEHYKWTK